MNKPHTHGMVVAEFNPQCENCQRRRVIQGIWEWVMRHCDHSTAGACCYPCLLEAVRAAYDRREVEF